jgi:hypothetical protein
MKKENIDFFYHVFAPFTHFFSKIDNYRLKSINTAILKVGEAKLTMKREKSIFLINAASVAKNERPVWAVHVTNSRGHTRTCGRLCRKVMGCGGSERERKGVEKRRTVFYQCLFSVSSVFYCKHASDWCPLLVAGLKEAKIDIG